MSRYKRENIFKLLSGSDRLPTNSMVEEILVCYFIGLVFGSLAIESLFKKFKVIPYTAYPSYVKALKADK